MAPFRTLKINRMILASDMNSNGKWGSYFRTASNTLPSTLEQVVYNENVSKFLHHRKCVPGSCTFVLQLLEQIFKFLPMEDLLSTRHVCTTWKSESDRILKLRQTLIVLRTEDDIRRITDIMNKQEVLGQTKLFNKFLIVFDQIQLEQASVRNFLNRNGSFFEQLSLKFALDAAESEDAQNTPQSFKYLLEQQVPNLKSLQFFRLSKKLWLSGDLFDDSHNLLPKLKHIGCIRASDYKCHGVDTFAHERENCPLYLSLFRRLPCVKQITINCSTYWKILFSHAASDNSNPLRRFLSDVEEIRTEYCDLNLIKKSGMRTPFPERIGDPEILNLLPHLCPKVRILRLDYYPSINANKCVGRLLTKYADQLEELWINEHLHRVIYCGFRQKQRVNSDPLVNEFFTTSVFPKLRVIRTGVNIFTPSGACTQLFHKQLPMLVSLSLLCSMSRLSCDYDLQHIRLHTLVLSRHAMWRSDYLLAMGQVFSSIKRLTITLFEEDDLEVVVRAFPNIEELIVDFDFRNLTAEKIMCIGDLKRNYDFKINS